MRVRLLTKPDCPDCDSVRDLLSKLAPIYGVNIQEIDTSADTDQGTFGPVEAGVQLPIVQVVDVPVGRLVHPITEPELKAYLSMAQDVMSASWQQRSVTVHRETALDRIAHYMGKHWLRLALIGLGIFVTLPWLAPIFASLGWWGLANPIYTAYAIQCHQLPEREAHIFGYEVCQCWRCNALYGGMFLFGLVYLSARDRAMPGLKWLKKPLPIWSFALLLIPIIIDGLSHTFDLREPGFTTASSTFGSFLVGDQMFSLNWTLRIITGLAAALGSIWFAFPRMQRALDDAEALRLMYRKAAVGRAQVGANS
jgi:uncharacterized membrane protein